MEDRQIKNKPEAFAEYKRRVPSALLLVPPPVNRAIGEWLYGRERACRGDEVIYDSYSTLNFLS